MSRSFPGGPGVTGEPRRRLFSSWRAPQFTDPRVEAILSASHHMMMERLETALDAIEQSATTLMREIADEVWHVNAAEGEAAGSRILEALARDEAVKGLIAHSDERYQLLDMRVARIEESLESVDRAAVELRELIDESIGRDALYELRQLAERSEGGAAGTELAEKIARVETAIASFERMASTLQSDLHSQTEAVRREIKLEKDIRFDRLFDRVVELEETLTELNRTAQEQPARLDAALTEVHSRLLDQPAQVRTAVAEELGSFGATTGEQTARLELALEEIRQRLETDEAPRELRERLEAVQQYLVSAVQYLWERDRALAEWLQQMAKHDGETLQAETERLHAAIGTTVGETERRLVESVGAELRSVTEQVAQHARLIGEAIGSSEARALEAVEGVTGKVDAIAGGVDAVAGGLGELGGRLDELRQVSESATGTISELVTARLAEVSDRVNHQADQIRSALATVATADDVAAVKDIDGRLARLSELVSAAMGWAVERMRQSIQKETFRSVQSALADTVAVMDRRFVEADRSLEAKVGELDRSIASRFDNVDRGVEERVERIGESISERVGELDRAVSERVTSLDQTVSERVTNLDQTVAQRVDQLDSTIGSRVGDLDQAIARMSEVDQRVQERIGELDRVLMERLAQIDHAVDERVGQMDRVLEERVGGIGQIVADRLGQFDAGVAERLDRIDGDVVERIAHMDRALQAGVGALEEAIVDRASQAIDQTVALRVEPMMNDVAEAIRSLRGDVETRIASALSDRVTALARMIRSDNQALVKRLEVVEEQSAAKEAIRAVKELTAALPDEIGEAIDRRLRVLADLMRQENRVTVDLVERTAGALAERMDKTVIRIGERFDREVEHVVDSIGDTMANLATGLQRGAVVRGRNGDQ